jgi:signal peptidase I
MKRYWVNHLGKSMKPYLNDGDWVLIEEVGSHLITKGDVVFYYDRESKEMVLHRMIDFNFTLKGDWAKNKESISLESVFGKAIAVKKNGKVILLPKNQSFKNMIIFFSRKCPPMLYLSLVSNLIYNAVTTKNRREWLPKDDLSPNA